jgi:3-carboxy-cis,cis-muconate cycloisomerase
MTLIDDACERLDTVRDSLPAQLGGAAGTLAALSIDQVAPYARELGLVEPVVPWHTLRTPIADLGAALAFVSGALGKFALDVTMLAATEVGEVAEPAAAGRGGSSAMPHKRNPVLATMIVSAARQVPSYTSVLMQSMLAEHERPAGAWHAEWQPLRGALRLVGGAAFTAAELAAGLTVDAERMRRNLDLTHGLIVSERLAGALAEKYGAESAKHLMTRVSAEAVGLGLPLREILAEENLPEELFNPANYTGEAEVLVDRALAAHARRSWK